MSIAVFAVPYVPPPPPIPPWRGYEVIWRGWDGSEWNLTDWRTSGVVLMMDGLTGIHTPLFDDYVATSPRVAGQRYLGSRTQARTIDLTLLIYNDENSEGWIAQNDAFWYSMRPDRTGTLLIRGPGGKERSIDLRYTPTSAHSFSRDPASSGWAVYQPTMTADDPYFYGDWIDIYEWQNETPQPFIPVTGAQPLNISNSSSSDKALLNNPGDVAAWPQILITGPVTATVSIGSGSMTFPAVASGDVLTAETDPRIAKVTSITTGGVVTDRWASVIPWDPRPLPVGEDISIGLSMSGTGRVKVRFQPRYFRGT